MGDAAMDIFSDGAFSHFFISYGQRLGSSLARCFSASVVESVGDFMEVQLQPIPGSLTCPISMDVMSDPVATVDGCTYERSQILRWFEHRRQDGLGITSPATGLQLDSAFLMPLSVLHHAVIAYIRHRPEMRDNLISEEELRGLENLVEKCERLQARVDQLEGVEAANKALQARVDQLEIGNDFLARELAELRFQLRDLGGSSG